MLDLDGPEQGVDLAKTLRGGYVRGAVARKPSTPFTEVQWERLERLGA